MEKERGDGWIRKNNDGGLPLGHGTFQSSPAFPNTWQRHRRETDTENKEGMGKKMREFNLIYPHDFSMFWLYGSNIHCHYCLASRDQGKVKGR